MDLTNTGKKSLMAQWLRQASQGHEMYCHDLEVMGLNPGWVDLGVHGTFVEVVLEPKKPPLYFVTYMYM